MTLLSAPVTLFVCQILLIELLWILGNVGLTLILVALLVILFTTLCECRTFFGGGGGSRSLGIVIHQHQRLRLRLRILVITAISVIIRQIILDLVMLRVARFDKSIQ